MPFKRFSTPFEGDFAELAGLLAQRCFGKACATVNRIAERIGRDPVIDGMSVSGECAVACWNAELGAVRVGIDRGLFGEEHWDWLSNQLRLSALMGGAIPQLSFEARPKHPFTVAGYFVHADVLRVDADDRELTAVDGDGRLLLHLRRSSEPGIRPVWSKADGTPVVRLGSVAAAVPATTYWLDYWFPEVPRNTLSAGTGHCRRVEEAMAVLEDGAAAYYTWTALLLRELVGIEAEKTAAGSTASTSYLFWPGHVQCSLASVAQTVTMLIHECSHQYFHLLQWLAPVITPDAPEVFSILKNRSRPLDRVLLGFHAFGNCALGLARLRDVAGGAEADAYDRESKHACELARSLAAQLDPLADTCLEPTGQDLYFPLRQRLAGEHLLAPA